MLKQGINTKMTCPYYFTKFRNTTTQLLQVYLSFYVLGSR